MDTKAINSRLKQIFDTHSLEEICAFVEAYAYDNQALALALIDTFGTFDSNDAKAIVEQCFMHPATTSRFGTSLNWYAIGEDLGKVFQKAIAMKDQGDDLGAALIARYMLTMTYSEYMDDHPDLELTRGMSGDLHVREALDMLRELLIDGNKIDFDTRKGMLKEIAEEMKPIRKKDWLGRLDLFLDDAKSITMTRKGYIGFMTRKISSTYGCYRWDNVERLMRYLLKNDDLSEARHLLNHHSDCGAARLALIDYLADHQLYDEALETIEASKDTFNMCYFKLDDKFIDILRREGDNDKLINRCRKRFLENIYRWPYYQALKSAVPEKDWNAFLTQLLADCDFRMDCDDTQLKIYRAEHLLHLFYPFFIKQKHPDYRQWAEYGGLMTEDEQREVGEKICQHIIEIAKDQKSRRDYRIVAEFVAEFKKPSALAKKMGDKLVDRILQAVPGRPALYDELMKV